MSEVFHKAARDGYLDLLREATKKDCNNPDEDGMTPTCWAAFHGNLEALRVIVGRGGNPDKCDIFGSTALHHATANGHLNCVSFLVSFGANLWSLDNDMHTALDVAGIRDHAEIVRFLDSVVAKQSALNKKVVRKLKEKAILEAEKRINKYKKMQEKAQRRLEKESRKLGLERQKLGIADMDTSSSSSGDSSTPTQSMTNSISSGAFSKSSFPTSKPSGVSGPKHSQPLSYSDHVHNTVKSGKFSFGVQRKIRAKRRNGTNDFKVAEYEADGKRSIKSLAGLRRDDHIMYVGKANRKTKVDEIFSYDDNRDTDSIPYSEPAFHMNGSEESGVKSRLNGKLNGGETASIFERPGFGSVAFFSRPKTTSSLIALSSEASVNDPEKEGLTTEQSSSRFKRQGSITDSIGTLGSLAARIRDLPWGEDDVETLDDDEEECSPLELFLVSNGLTDYLSLFAREQVDLEALLLLSDEDLKELGVPMGPRRKILDAISRRKRTTENPPAITDTRL